MVKHKSIQSACLCDSVMALRKLDLRSLPLSIYNRTWKKQQALIKEHERVVTLTRVPENTNNNSLITKPARPVFWTVWEMGGLDKGKQHAIV